MRRGIRCMLYGILIGVFVSMFWAFVTQCNACVDCGVCVGYCDMLHLFPGNGGSEYSRFTFMYMVIFSIAFGLVGLVFGLLSSLDKKNRNSSATDFFSKRGEIITVVVIVCVVAFLFFAGCEYCSTYHC